MNRRVFITTSACAMVASTVRAAEPVRARRPTPPYRVWFQPLLFERDIDLYANMTIDASGWLDPRLAEAQGKTSLDWVYGLVNPYAKGPETWQKTCTPQGRGFPRKSPEPTFISAGIVIDEWVPPKPQETEQWLCAGLRAGKRENPEVFITVWLTDPTPSLIELGRDGIVDLFIVEGYTHCAPDAGPGLVTSWKHGLHRCDGLVQAGLEARTIYGFGHINGTTQLKGERLSGQWLREHMAELKRLYPKMPGVAFFQNKSDDTPELRELIRTCDRRSAEFWP